MSAICVIDCDCDDVAAIGFPGLAVRRFCTELDACVAWLAGDARFLHSFRVELPAIDRYYCVHGPGGHVIGVRP